MTNDLEDKIRKVRLTKKEGEIAEYILHNPYEVCFMTASDLAKKLDTSNTSVNRTATALGYGLFSDMQKELQEYVAAKAGRSDNDFSLSPSQRILREEHENMSRDHFTQIYQQAAYSLVQTVNKNPSKKIEEVVELLANSRNKYIHGYRSTAEVAGKLAYLLELICDNIMPTCGESVSTMAQLLGADEQDCVVVISFNRYYKSSYDVVELCHQQKLKIVLITDHLTAPMAHLADIVLLAEVGSLSFFNSNVAAMFLVEAICAGMVRRLGEKANKRLNAIEPYIRKLQMGQ